MNNDYGEFTKLATLPVGTRFWVRNGCWNGKIVEVNGSKSLYIVETGRTRTINKDDELAIDIK